MWGKEEEKDQQKAEKQNMNEGGKAVFERCKQKGECTRKPPTKFLKTKRQKNKILFERERDSANFNKLFVVQWYEFMK